MTFIEKIVAYMTRKGYVLFRQPGELNIVYIEGVNLDGSDNRDDWDRFNDVRVVFDFMDDRPRLLYTAQATTEPGKAPTFTLAAIRRGGIFRIGFGQFMECWQDGFHKGRPDHPGLIQIKGSPVWGYRDRNKDGKRTGDRIDIGVGVNHHGTKPGFTGKLVAFFSEGCLVARHWADHIKFVFLYRQDVRFQADKRFKFSATIIAGDDLNRAFPE